MSIPAIMRALEQASLDGPQALRLVTDAPVRSPGPGEVLIRVAAAGVNFLDISQSRGTSAGGRTPPYLAGIEGAGEVVSVGEGLPALSSALTSSASALGEALSLSTWCCQRQVRSQCRQVGPTSRRWAWSCPGRPRWRPSNRLVALT